MSRFFRYSRVSPLELCLESERLAWRSGFALVLCLFAGALGALFTRAPEGYTPKQVASDFTGIHVEVPEEAPPPAAPAAPPQAFPALAEPLPQLALVAQLPPLPALSPDWEAVEGVEGEPPLALELPAALVPPSAPRSSAARSAAAAPPSAPSGETVAARYRSTPRPPYPPALLSRRVEGRVGLRVSVDAEGVPQEVEVCSSSGHAAFDRCAREWVLAHWRFYPARRGGVAVASVVRTQLEFVLR